MSKLNNSHWKRSLTGVGEYDMEPFWALVGNDKAFVPQATKSFTAPEDGSSLYFWLVPASLLN